MRLWPPTLWRTLVWLVDQLRAEEFEFKDSTRPLETCRDCHVVLAAPHADWCIYAPGYVHLTDIGPVGCHPAASPSDPDNEMKARYGRD